MAENDCTGLLAEALLRNCEKGILAFFDWTVQEDGSWRGTPAAEAGETRLSARIYPAAAGGFLTHLFGRNEAESSLLGLRTTLVDALQICSRVAAQEDEAAAERLARARLPDGICIDWIAGYCPVQAEGRIDGTPFVFRARWEHWSLSVGEQASALEAWQVRQDYEGGEFAAGWMSLGEAIAFITKGATRWRAEAACGPGAAARAGQDCLSL